MKKNKIDLSKLIDDETEKRLNIMQKKDYEFPKKATKADFIGIILIISICLILIILCMIGVIE